MSIALLFWLLFIIGVALWLFKLVTAPAFNVLEIFILVQIFLLGCGIFGWPIKRGE